MLSHPARQGLCGPRCAPPLASLPGVPCVCLWQAGPRSATFLRTKARTAPADPAGTDHSRPDKHPAQRWQGNTQSLPGRGKLQAGTLGAGMPSLRRVACVSGAMQGHLLPRASRARARARPCCRSRSLFSRLPHAGSARLQGSSQACIRCTQPRLRAGLARVLRVLRAPAEPRAALSSAAGDLTHTTHAFRGPGSPGWVHW